MMILDVRSYQNKHVSSVMFGENKKRAEKHLRNGDRKSHQTFFLRPLDQEFQTMKQGTTMLNGFLKIFRRCGCEKRDKQHRHAVH